MERGIIHHHNLSCFKCGILQLSNQPSNTVRLHAPSIVKAAIRFWLHFLCHPARPSRLDVGVQKRCPWAFQPQSYRSRLSMPDSSIAFRAKGYMWILDIFLLAPGVDLSIPSIHFSDFHPLRRGWISPVIWWRFSSRSTKDLLTSNRVANFLTNWCVTLNAQLWLLFQGISIGNGFITAIDLLILSVLYLPAICCISLSGGRLYIPLRWRSYGDIGDDRGSSPKKGWCSLAIARSSWRKQRKGFRSKK
jgi:hypothetical protein